MYYRCRTPPPEVPNFRKLFLFPPGWREYPTSGPVEPVVCAKKHTRVQGEAARTRRHTATDQWSNQWPTSGRPVADPVVIAVVKAGREKDNHTSYAARATRIRNQWTSGSSGAHLEPQRSARRGRMDAPTPSRVPVVEPVVAAVVAAVVLPERRERLSETPKA